MNRRRFLRWFSAASVGIATTTAGCMAPTRGAFLEVNERRCMGCGSCVKVCDGDAITLIANKAVIDSTKCIECGKCVKICPYEAIY